MTAAMKILGVVSGLAAVGAMGVSAHACDINSIDPACGYMSMNPANPLSVNNPSNPNNPNSGFNVTNPNSPYNQTHPENIWSAKNFGNLNNPLNNPSDPGNPGNRLRKWMDESEGSEHSPKYAWGVLGLLDKDHPAVLYYDNGSEHKCRLGTDCPKAVDEAMGIHVADQVPAEVAASPVPAQKKHKRHRSVD